MFSRKPPVASPAKHVIYLVASTILGLLVGFLVHAGLEILILQLLAVEGVAPIWSNGCALPRQVQFLLTYGGAVAGFFLGRYWWRKIYIEKAWCQRKK